MTRRWSCLAALSGAALLLATALIVYPLWLPLLGRWLVVADPLIKAEAIVPLAGGRERVSYAAQLYEQGYGEWFVTANMPLELPWVELTYADLVQREAVQDGVPEERFVAIAGTVHSTFEEAQAVRGLAVARGWKRLLVVTSPYHTRRARTIFGDVFAGSGIRLNVRPVAPDGYDPERWWQDVESVRLTALEYLKFIAHTIGYH